MLSSGGQHDTIEQEAKECMKIAKEYTLKIQVPFTLLPSELAISPIQLRNQCTIDSQIVEKQDKATPDKDLFIQGIKQNLQQLTEAGSKPAQHIYSQISNQSEETVYITQESKELDVSMRKQRQEFVIRLLSLFILFLRDKSLRKKRRYWKSQKEFVKNEVLKWVQPLTICMDPPHSLIPTHHFQAFLLCVPDLFEDSEKKRLQAIFKFLKREFEVEDDSIPLHDDSKVLPQQVESTKSASVLQKRSRSFESSKKISHRTLPTPHIRQSRSFYHSGSIMKQVVIRRKGSIKKREIEGNGSPEPPTKRRRCNE